MVDEHFGHCKAFRIYSVAADGSIVEEQSMPSLEGCGCKSGVAVDLARAGVTHLVGGNMGEGALRVLNARGIDVVRGASGPAREAAEAFARGSLQDSGGGCAGHGDECSH